MKGKTRQIAILVLGMFFLTLGFSIIMPILPYYTQKMGASALDLGLLMASYSVMQFIVTPFWGEMSDRVGRKPIFDRPVRLWSLVHRLRLRHAALDAVAARMLGRGARRRDVPGVAGVHRPT